MSPAVSIIVPAKDAAATLPRLLDALDRLDPVDGGHEVLLVDSGSSDATVALAKGRVDRVLENPGGGPATSRTLGARDATAPLLAFTDADCAPEAGWLRAGVRALERHDLVQGAVVPRRGVPRGPWDRTVDVGLMTGLWETASLFVRRDVLLGVGGFELVVDAETGADLRGRHRPFGEDTRFGWACVRAGAKTGFAADAVVEHEVFPRGPREYVREAARRRFFPELVAAAPELREAFLHERFFLTRRSARFDLAALGVVAARRSPLTLAATAPYVLEVVRDRRRRGTRAALVEIAADAVSAAALARGSLAARRLVL